MSEDDTRSLLDRTNARRSLVLIALVATALWRLEVAWHGWEGLTWIEYFHWAVPVGIAMFVGWVGTVGDFPSNARRWAWIIGAAIVAPVVYIVTRYALVVLFVAGPSATPFALQYGVEELRWARYVAVTWLVAVPLIVSSIGRLVGLPVTLGEIAISMLVFVCSYPSALLVIELLESSIPTNAIHAIKTGYVVPFQIVGLGIPFLPGGGQSCPQG